MHKFTIFTVVFAVLMLSVVTELALSKYKASVFLSQVEQQVEQPYDSQSNMDSSEALISETLNQDLLSAQAAIQEPVPQASIKQKSITDVFRPKSRFVMFLPSLIIDSLNHFELDFDGKLFATIDTSKLSASTIYNLQILQKNSEIAMVNELHFENTSQAQLAFNIIQATADSYKQIDTNVTNEFGSESFYINNPAKVDRAFLVIRYQDIIYALNYKRDFHSAFKDFFPVLLK